jgi:two-component system response regulator CpxR
MNRGFAVHRILIIDDDVELCELVTQLLEPEGFEVEATHDGASGAERALSGGHQLVILDVMLPEMSGFDVLRSIRASSQVPVLMLTARGEDVDRIVGLEMGADDYLPKPFNPRELVARMRAILRRAEATGTASESAAVLAVGDLRLDLGARTVRRGDETVPVTGTEFAILEVLVRSAGRVVTRDDLSRQALGRRASALDRSLDAHLSNLRKKLGPLPAGMERIKTVRGLGYQYVRPAGD